MAIWSLRVKSIEEIDFIVTFIVWDEKPPASCVFAIRDNQKLPICQWQSVSNRHLQIVN